MKNKEKIGLIITAAFILVLISGCAQVQCGDGICQPREERAGSCLDDCEKTNSLAFPDSPDSLFSDYKVKNMTTIIENGGRLDWSKNLNLIAFDRKAADNFYDVWLMKPDGTNQVCITCAIPNLPQKHVGQPEWHPSGEYIVLQAEKDNHTGGSLRARPGIGVDNDLWAITIDGKKAYRLTNIPSDKAILHPKFSHQGDKLIWVQMVETPPEGEMLGGKWEIKIADLIMEENSIHLENIKSLDLGKYIFFETHGFSQDDSKIIFSANMELNQPAWAMDIYVMDLETRIFNNLTSSDDWDEHAHFSPSGEKIVWMSSKDSGSNPKDMANMKTDLWIMSTDGTEKQRLTHFSDPSYPEYKGEIVIVGDPSWSPDGTKVMLRLIVNRGLPELLGLKEEIEPIILIEFE